METANTVFKVLEATPSFNGKDCWANFPSFKVTSVTIPLL